jgi:hypothetical protein
MSYNIECDLMDWTESSRSFAVQVDESIHVACLSVLLAIVERIPDIEGEE